MVARGPPKTEVEGSSPLRVEFFLYFCYNFVTINSQVVKNEILIKLGHIFLLRGYKKPKPLTTR